MSDSEIQFEDDTDVQDNDEALQQAAQKTPRVPPVRQRFQDVQPFILPDLPKSIEDSCQWCLKNGLVCRERPCENCVDKGRTVCAFVVGRGTQRGWYINPSEPETDDTSEWHEINASAPCQRCLNEWSLNERKIFDNGDVVAAVTCNGKAPCNNCLDAYQSNQSNQSETPAENVINCVYRMANKQVVIAFMKEYLRSEPPIEEDEPEMLDQDVSDNSPFERFKTSLYTYDTIPALANSQRKTLKLLSGYHYVPSAETQNVQPLA